MTVGSGAPTTHVEIAQDTTTETTVTNANTAGGTTASENAIFKVTIAGTPLELKATGVSGSGSLTNQTINGEHKVTTGAVITFTGVTVVKPEGKGCKVYEDNAEVEGTEGIVKTKELKGTTEGQGDAIKFEPASGTVFATFFITCTGEVPEALKGTWSVTGSAKFKAEGATLFGTHEDLTGENTLKAKGSKAGINCKVTVTAKEPIDAFYHPISLTTRATP